MTKFYQSSAIKSIAIGTQFVTIVFQSNPEKFYSFGVTSEGIEKINSLPEGESIGKLYHKLVKTGNLIPIK